MSQEILILERSSGQFVPAIFHEDLSADQLAEAETQWKPVRTQAVDRMRAAGKTDHEILRLVQHAHWDWLLKAQAVRESLLSTRCFGIELSGQWQGLVMIQLAGRPAELEPDRGRPVVYAEFLEIAPWNLKMMVAEPKFGLVGARLMEAAVRQSMEEGFHGRVGLLALPQAEAFCERCGMTRVEEEGRHGMAWYEFTRDKARAFLEGDR